MNKKHPNGYWVQQLTDEKIEELLRKLLTTSTKKFKRIINQERTDDAIAIKCCSTKTKSYFTYAESNLVITDYKVVGNNSNTKFYEYMIETFGKAYAKDLIVYIDRYIAQNPDDALSTRLASIKTKIPAMVEKCEVANNNL